MAGVVALATVEWIPVQVGAGEPALHLVGVFALEKATLPLAANRAWTALFETAAAVVRVVGGIDAQSVTVGEIGPTLAAIVDTQLQRLEAPVDASALALALEAFGFSDALAVTLPAVQRVPGEIEALLVAQSLAIRAFVDRVEVHDAEAARERASQ